MTNKPTPEQLAAARANFAEFQRRDPQTAASLHGLIEGEGLGNRSQVIEHFANSSDAPARRSLEALLFFKE